jgi:protein subunit release factor A
MVVMASCSCPISSGCLRHSRAAAAGAVVRPGAPVASSEHFFAVTPGDLGQRLANEFGIHRAQIVPRDSQGGRICTSAVGVEFLGPGAEPSVGKPDTPVLKTYNYQQGRVTRHATGERRSLDAVLSGQA